MRRKEYGRRSTKMHHILPHQGYSNKKGGEGARQESEKNSSISGGYPAQIPLLFGPKIAK